MGKLITLADLKLPAESRLTVLEIINVKDSRTMARRVWFDADCHSKKVRDMQTKMLFRVAAISLLLACPCFAIDYKKEVRLVGDICVLESEATGDWAVVSPEPSTELWVSPDGRFCVPPTNVTRDGRMTVEVIQWDLKRRDRWFITIGPVKPPTPPIPPTPVDIPNKYGVGAVFHQQALAIDPAIRTAQSPQMIASLRLAAREMPAATSETEQNLIYERHKSRMDATLAVDWMPLRVATQAAFQNAWRAGKIRSYADQAGALSESADALELVK